MRGRFIGRIRVLSGGIMLVAVLLLGRLYYLQVVEHNVYREMADRQYSRPVSGIYDRGSIFFSDKDGHLVAAATLNSGFTLAAIPPRITDPEGTYASLAEALPLTESETLAKLKKIDDPYEELARRLTEDAALSIRALDAPGILLVREKWRYYPGNSLAAQALGFVAYEGDELSGRYGLERYYEEVLTRAKDGGAKNFFAEIFSSVASAVNAEPVEGDLVTAIEPTVQLALERELRDIQERWQGKRAGGVIMDPTTGEIVALGVLPSYDLNAFSSQKNPSIYANPLVENVYEMGSIMKPLTVAAGLDAKVITAESTYNDKGYLALNTERIENFDGKARGTVSMQEVLNQSLNTGAAYVAAKIGNRRFADYLEKFGITEEAGVDLPNEASPLVENLSSPRDIEYATASFGQGIAVTPIAMVRSLSALANSGVPVTPHVGRGIRNKTGIVRKITYPEAESAISRQAADEITRMLVEVVDSALLEGRVKLPNYSVAAKTGTAQIASPNGGYYDDRYLHSFFGYFPAYEPRYLIFLYTEEPHGVKYASQTLTEPFHALTKFLINYYAIPPDR